MSANPAEPLIALGNALAARLPRALDAAITLLESIRRALAAARVERYQIERPIGSGGMAEVFLGSVRGASGFARPVAIKRVRADRTDDRELAARLSDEARWASRFSHPNLVSVLDFDRDAEGRRFLVMEYVDGITLAQLIEAGPVPYPVVIFIVRELLAALGYLHRFRCRGGIRGFVHRDVTPHNVLISRSGEVKLADFGLMMAVGDSAPGGTPGYMSPEQADREKLDGRSDLYVLGIVLWELLACERLRLGHPYDVTAARVRWAVPRPSEYRQGIPRRLAAVTMRLLGYHREARYPTAELAARDLMRCQDAPRDGRAALLLAEHLALGHRGPNARMPELASTGTVTDDQ
jgi:serine/threonine-protein kinase